MPRRRLAVIDFDGTLLRSDGTISAADREALRRAAAQGVVLALATGRSPFSLRRTLGGPPPVDFTIFSTGLGIRSEPAGEILWSTGLDAAETARAAGILLDAGLDFMVQEPVPDNHRFVFHDSGQGTPDFHRRIALYPDHSRPLDVAPADLGPAAQLISILAPGEEDVPVEDWLPELSVIRATSPVDHESTWLEILPRGVNKSAAATRLADHLGIDPGDALAVGNDVNDLDLLAWAGTAYGVADSHPDVLAGYPRVAGHDESGVAEALALWLG